jgi:hypothetical protein
MSLGLAALVLGTPALAIHGAGTGGGNVRAQGELAPFTCHYRSFKSVRKSCGWRGRCCALNTDHETTTDCKKANFHTPDPDDVAQNCQPISGAQCDYRRTLKCLVQPDVQCSEHLICSQGNNFVYDRDYQTTFHGTAFCFCSSEEYVRKYGKYDKK